MSLLLFLVTGLVLCVSDETRQEESSKLATEETQGKLNLLWLAVLYPHMFEHLYDANWTYTACEMKPSTSLEGLQPQVTGRVLFKQGYPHGKLMAIFYLDGFPMDTDAAGKAIHIHELGDLSNGCDSLGGHYNPFQVHHPNHPGDFGNFHPKNGRIRTLRVNLSPSLHGPRTVVGRSVVIHENPDDMGKGNNKGSLEHGNAGKRLACCVIGYSQKNLWAKAYNELLDLKD
ncbi:extracellular superoxide dismutase [Cu-Zn] [Heteronotia binoei]|uniref:extracellular superoxide dismutase [Cu-Zn] n=1 Tax=Heteronotia binoei TaxID=13085 RepID=UPI00292CF419|nr:extracellular superoxide dismutase [Cu-Zn] [Heteronotia binoei]